MPAAIMESPAEIVARPSVELEREKFMPVMSVQLATERRTAIKEAIAKLMEPDQDYGIIPGTGTKPTLLQPGAQKLDNLFGLVARFELIEKQEDWTGGDHDGEPLFRYLMRCVLYRGDYIMGEGVGEANSWETKYRWRKSERTCPACGQANIRKSKQDGGWYCWQKTGGCGAKFKTGDPTIENQDVGRIPNPDIFDQINTLVKMANKRAHVAATINTTSASEFFTQDVDDLNGQPEEPISVAQQSKPTQVAQPVIPRPWATFKGMLQTFEHLKASLGPYENLYYTCLAKHGVKHANEFKDVSAATKAYEELSRAVSEYQQLKNTPPSDEQDPGF